MRELGKLGYETHMKDDVVQVVIDPEDFVSGHKKLRADLDRLGWNRSYSYKPSRRLTPEEKEEYERNTDHFPELRGAADRQQPAAKKQQHPARRSGSPAYRARMAEVQEDKRSRKAAGQEVIDQIPGQMDIFQFLGGEA